MSIGAWMMVLVALVTVATLTFLVFSMVRSIQNERSPDRSVWRDFSLGLSLMILFFATWTAQGIAEWQVFTNEQSAHGEPTEIGDFVSEFAQSTLENWQSEFLQLFSFVVLAALYIHRGSAESKDGEERLEAALRRIEEYLFLLHDAAPTEKSQSWKLPDTPLRLSG